MPSGYQPELAWTCCDYADTLLQRNEPGDREKTVSLLDDALAVGHAAFDGAGTVQAALSGCYWRVGMVPLSLLH